MEQRDQIIKYLEDSFTGANQMNDSDMMVRLRRAINAFNLNIEEEFDLDYVCVEKDGKIIYL